jgi:hypothetical protein
MIAYATSFSVFAWPVQERDPIERIRKLILNLELATAADLKVSQVGLFSHVFARRKTLQDKLMTGCWRNCGREMEALKRTITVLPPLCGTASGVSLAPPA